MMSYPVLLSSSDPSICFCLHWAYMDCYTEEGSKGDHASGEQINNIKLDCQWYTRCNLLPYEILFNQMSRLKINPFVKFD
jgi:hypothetical protein